MRPQASFLLWLDFSAYGLSSNELQLKIVNEAKLALNKGTSFGLGGEQYFRMNVATPRSVLEEAIMRLGKVFA
jgi:cysteine-S-conjugate beta-lyase